MGERQGVFCGVAGEGGGGVGRKNKWPDMISPAVNFVFPSMVTLVWGGGGVVGEGIPPLVF